MRKVLVTGGTGFLGSALTIELIRRGYVVRVLDNNFRGRDRRLAPVRSDIEYLAGDIRDQVIVDRATEGVDWVFHLAFVNGTRYFYEQPGLVLDVGVRGALTTMDAAKRFGIERYIVASSAEVYQEPTRVPTAEGERIVIPDVTNPRFSYSGGKIITELLTLHYLVASDARRIIFRPHNVYGPDMGWEHVIPEFMRRIRDSRATAVNGRLSFPIQGNGKQTRAFCYVDDAVRGILLAAERGEDANVYHVGVEEEISIGDLATHLGRIAGVEILLVMQDARAGSTPRRCPDITKLRSLGYEPKVSLDDGLRRCWDWYQHTAVH